MKTLILTLAFIFGTIFIKAQDSQRRIVNTFQNIEISGSVHVFYTQSDSSTLDVRALTRELQQVQTEVYKGTLSISNKGRFTGPVSVYIKGPHLKLVDISGTSSFHSLNTLNTDTLEISLSGSAIAEVSITAHAIRSVQSGATVLILSGNADYYSCEQSGASSLRGFDLVCKEVNILATGASASRLYVTDKLKADASGASSIKIKGEVTDINAEASAGSSIIKIAGNDLNQKDGRDSSVYNWKGRKLIIIGREKEEQGNDSARHKLYSKGKFKHWAGISVGVNGYMAPGGGIGLPGKSSYMELNYSRSFNFQFNLIERQFNIVQNYFKIITGFGFDYHSYELKNKTTLNADSSFTAGTMDKSGQFTYDKNRLRNTYIQVPLLLEFNTSNNARKTVHIAVGIVGEYLISSRTRQVLEEDKVTLVRTRKDSYNMSPFIAKSHINIGYRGWTIFAEYNLTPLFQSEKGPELYPFTVGLRVIPFG